MTAREYVPVRLSQSGLAAAKAIADAQFDGNLSAAIRQLLAIGVASWNAGIRGTDLRKHR